METILIWLGSGFVFAVGWMAGMIVIGLMLKRTTPDTKIQAESVQLLRERNEIGERQVKALQGIAYSLENIAIRETGE